MAAEREDMMTEKSNHLLAKAAPDSGFRLVASEQWGEVAMESSKGSSSGCAMTIQHACRQCHAWKVAIAMLPFAIAACSSGEVRSASSDAAQGAVGKNSDSGMRTVSPDAASPSDANDASVFGCASQQDCWNHLSAAPSVGGVVPQVVCCINHVCILGKAAVTVTCPNPDGEIIQASNYDQSCTNDSDCAPVAVGDFCDPTAGTCPNAAINKDALSQYQADVAKTQAAMCGTVTGCPGYSFSYAGPCCRQGKCQFGGCN